MVNKVNRPCIYCKREAAGAQEEYHIIPYSAGNIAEARYPLDELTLPTGLVCDKCNHYFGLKVEPHLTGHPIVQLWRVLKVVKGRAKTLEYKSEGVKLSSRKHKILVVEQGQNEEFRIDRSGVIKIKNPSLDKVNHTGVSRALHKIAFEYEIKMILDEMVKKEVAKGGHSGTRAGANTILVEDSSGVRIPIKTLELPEIKISTEIENERVLYNSPAIVESVRKIILNSDYDYMRNYIRQPKPSEYRPYGMVRGGGTGANVNSISFKSSDDSKIVGHTFNAYIITLTGVRFIVTTAPDPMLLSYAFQQIDKCGLTNRLGATEIYWNAKCLEIWSGSTI